MAIVYPLSQPTGRKLSSIELRGRSVVSVTESPFTFQDQVQEFSGQRWEAVIQTALMERPEAEEWNAFFLSLRGKFGTFLLGDPLGATPRGVATGTPLVKGASQTGGTLITDGWTPNTTGILLRGDYIQLFTGGSARLYKLLEDANSDGIGDATLSIWPDLRESPPDNEPLIITNTVGLFRLNTNEVFWSERKLTYQQISFPCVEVV